MSTHTPSPVRTERSAGAPFISDAGYEAARVILQSEKLAWRFGDFVSKTSNTIDAPALEVCLKGNDIDDGEHLLISAALDLYGWENETGDSDFCISLDDAVCLLDSDSFERLAKAVFIRRAFEDGL